jgi:acyl-CoA dehydrogenase
MGSCQRGSTSSYPAHQSHPDRASDALNRVVEHAIQVPGALGYPTDTPVLSPVEGPPAMMAQQARWARFADGADKVHQWRIAQRTIDAYEKHKSTKAATGNLSL